MCTMLMWALLFIGVNLVSGLLLMVICFAITFNPRFYRWMARRCVQSMNDLDEVN